MIEPSDFLHFRELMRDGARLMEDVIISRWVSESKNSYYPDAPPTVVRHRFRVRVEISPYPLQVVQQPGGVLRTGDLRILSPKKLVGATGDEENPANLERADIVERKGSKYRVFDLPAGYQIDGGHTLWVSTLRLLSGI